MNIIPLFDRIVLKEEKIENEKKSGIIVPDIAQQKPIFATVTHIGTGGKIEGNEIEFKVKVGDKVVFNQFASHEFVINNKRFILIKQEDILAIIED